MTKEMYQAEDEGLKDTRFSQELPHKKAFGEFIRPEARFENEEKRELFGKQKTSSGATGRSKSWLPFRLNREPRPIETVKQRKSGQSFSTWQGLSTVLTAGVIVATLLTVWMPGSLMPGSLEEKVLNPTAPVQEDAPAEQAPIIAMPANFPKNKIGIVVGHLGSDTGAVCADGLTEVEVNSNVGTFVQQLLIEEGFEVELLNEFDERLSDYQAGLLLSIHADSCEYINDSATGFKVTGALSQTNQANSDRLVACLSGYYAKVTGLKYHYQSVTTDMTYYHAFNEINPYTTAGIIEVGFLNLDRGILTSKPELIAKGIVEGILCFMDNE